MINRIINTICWDNNSIFWRLLSSGTTNLIKNKKELDQILDQYTSNGSYPFLYAHIENIDGEYSLST